MIIAVIAGTAALWMALRLDSVWSTFIASLVAGMAVNGMHYTGMAAVQAHAAPGLVVSTADTASATGFLREEPGPNEQGSLFRPRRPSHRH